MLRAYARPLGSSLAGLLLLGCAAARPPRPLADPASRGAQAIREIVDRHGHTLAHLPPASGDAACAPDLLAFVQRPGSVRGPIATRLDGGVQALAQAVLQGGVERLARTRLPADPGAGPPRPGQARVGTVVRVVAEGLLVDVGAAAPALLPLPAPVACAGHAAALLPPPSARFRAGERLLVRVVAAASEGAPAQVRLGLQGALVALDPQSRDVLALVGGYGQRPGDEDRALQRPRPAGAVFLPIIYAAALATGRWTARSQVDVGAFGGAGRRIGLREALGQASTPAAVRLLSDVGVDAVLTLAGRLGIPVVQLPRDLSLAQRAELTPWQVAAAYATLADSRAGRHAPPRLLGEDGDGGGGEGPGEVRPAVAYQVSRLLHGVVEAGAATAAQDLGVADLAGQTGTGQGGRDAWFVGYHADLLCVVWVGVEGREGSGVAQLSGAASALPIWIDFMEGAVQLQGRSPPPLPRPPGPPPEGEPAE